MKMEQTECSETSAYKIQTPGNYPEENIQQTESFQTNVARVNITTSVLHTKPSFVLSGENIGCGDVCGSR